MTVLVVDDAAIDRRMTGAIIDQHLGWRVTYAEDGAAALAAMARATPRLVLTDLRMPGSSRASSLWSGKSSISTRGAAASRWPSSPSSLGVMAI